MRQDAGVVEELLAVHAAVAHVLQPGYEELEGSPLVDGQKFPQWTPYALHATARQCPPVHRGTGETYDGNRRQGATTSGLLSHAYRTANPARGLNVLPSARTAFTQMAAGVPSFIGLPVIVSRVPALEDRSA